MADIEYEANDEVFNLLTRKVGTVLNVKDVDTAGHRNKRFVRVCIKPDQADEIWGVDEIALWVRPKKMMHP